MAKNVLKDYFPNIKRQNPPVAALWGSQLATKMDVPLKVYVNGDLATTTLTDNALAGYGTDYFKNWVIQFQANNAQTTGLTVGEMSIVSASTDLGKLTFAALTAATKEGDEFHLIPPWMAADKGVGTTFIFQKSYATGHPTSAGDTLATATGSVFIKSAKFQGNAVTAATASTGIKLTSNDTIPLAQVCISEADNATFKDKVNGLAGVNPAIPIGHLLATTKVLTIAAIGANVTCTGFYVELECVRNSVNASLA
jgi:hypothetical protein